jgi:hypothetical protein
MRPRRRKQASPLAAGTASPATGAAAPTWRPSPPAARPPGSALAPTGPPPPPRGACAPPRPPPHGPRPSHRGMSSACDGAKDCLGTFLGGACQIPRATHWRMSCIHVLSTECSFPCYSKCCSCFYKCATNINPRDRVQVQRYRKHMQGHRQNNSV